MRETNERLSTVLCGATDDKARRVVNASARDAGITAGEIESGVTLERLQALPVPVFCYGTQLTIHGALPDLKTGYISRYKWAVKNANGSIGIRYGAVDCEKKALIRRACGFGEGPGRWLAKQDSTGTRLYRFFPLSDEAGSVACAADFTSRNGADFIGAVSRWKLPGDWFGPSRFMVEIEVGAVPVAGLWRFIEAVSGLDEAAFNAAVAAETEKQRARDLAWKLESEKQAAARAVAADEQRAKIAALVPGFVESVRADWVPVAAMPGAGRVMVARFDGGALVSKFYTIGRAFGKVTVKADGETKGREVRAGEFEKFAESGRLFVPVAVAAPDAPKPAKVATPTPAKVSAPISSNGNGPELWAREYVSQLSARYPQRAQKLAGSLRFQLEQLATAASVDQWQRRARGAFDAKVAR